MLSNLTQYAPQLPALALLAARGHVINSAIDTALQQLSVITRRRPGDAEARLMQARPQTSFLPAACVPYDNLWHPEFQARISSNTGAQKPENWPHCSNQ